MGCACARVRGCVAGALVAFSCVTASEAGPSVERRRSAHACSSRGQGPRAGRLCRMIYDILVARRRLPLCFMLFCDTAELLVLIRLLDISPLVAGSW
jgi:hypothetical protein